MDYYMNYYYYYYNHMMVIMMMMMILSLKSKKLNYLKKDMLTSHKNSCIVR